MSRCLAVLLMSVILLGGHLVSAQVTTATISGVVQDSSGAVIPGVSVAVKNIDTGVSRTITTDEGGRYVVPDLSLGNYEVEAQLPGSDRGPKRDHAHCGAVRGSQLRAQGGTAFRQGHHHWRSAARGIEYCHAELSGGRKNDSGSAAEWQKL